MRHKSPELMEKIRLYAENYYIEHHESPSTCAISRDLGIGRTTAFQYLKAMNEHGILHYESGQIESRKTAKVCNDYVSVAVLGSVSCGVPTLEDEYVEEYVQLPASMFGKGQFYLLRANGDSMTGAGIDSGDLVLVRKQTEAREGDIVVALVENENTLKRYYIDHENHKIRLHPENPEMEDILLNECSIQGVAVNVIKSLRNTEADAY